MELCREGIWVIRKIHNGIHTRFEGTKIEELPDIVTRSSFEPYRGILYSKLLKKQNEVGLINMSAKDVIKLIFESLKKN